LNIGTLYILDESRCEVLIQPEKPENIVQAKQELGDQGFKVEAAQVLGNFCVRLDEERGMKELQAIVVGEVVVSDTLL
jgi:hypothetical protein